MDAKTGGKCLAWCEGSGPETGSVNPSLLVEDAADRLSARFCTLKRFWWPRFAGRQRGRAQPATLFPETLRRRERVRSDRDQGFPNRPPPRPRTSTARRSLGLTPLRLGISFTGRVMVAPFVSSMRNVCFCARYATRAARGSLIAARR